MSQTLPPISQQPAHSNGAWITDRAWISGLVGAVLVVLAAFFYVMAGVETRGIQFLGFTLTSHPLHSKLVLLVSVALGMSLVEVVRLGFWYKGKFWSLHPKLKNRRFLGFLGEVAQHYLLLLLLFWLLRQFYHGAGEYGFVNRNPYYQPWFALLEASFYSFLVGAPAYIFITRALKHNPVKDERSYVALLVKLLGFGAARIAALRLAKPVFTSTDKKIALGFLVRLFFTPLMTVFFVTQFTSLIDNLNYAINGLPQYLREGTYTHERFNDDLSNLSRALIFCIDVTLAWCGYFLTSRWLDNETQSAEPTWFGWIVCLLSYPPFALVGLYISFPSEDYILHLGSPWFISLFSGLMVLSLLVYTATTVFFGVRFSNLTHRGIIRTGTFAFVRHPAYASKNFSWWLLIFPTVLYLYFAGERDLGFVIGSTLGLIIQSGIYYCRAITEERHLSQDPLYQAYCKQVPYRFIPGII